jgi:DNA-binding transcriptional ArsR family regulator
MLDQLRHDVQTRLDELLSEAEKLRHALAALTSRDGTTRPETDGSSSTSPARRRTRPAPASASASREPARSRKSATSQSTTDGASPKPDASRATTPANGASRAPARTAPGATKAAVLAALAHGSAMTAGEVANATGLGRATVSTTLSNLSKAGELTKAARGYVIAGQTSTE